MHSIRCNSDIKSRKNGRHLEKITKIKPNMDRYNSEGINY